MTPPPTSIDGTDITGATIDGQKVEEITVDGQTVFTATPLPVAYSNLIAWYPFDSGIYGGTNTSDVTAIERPSSSGDSTAFDLTVNGTGLTHELGEGVNDINDPNPSGAYENTDNSGSDFSGLPTFPTPFSFSVWYYDFGTSNTSNGVFGNFNSGSGDLYYYSSGTGGDAAKWGLTLRNTGNIKGAEKTNQWVCLVVTFDGSLLEVFHNTNSQGTQSYSSVGNPFRLASVGPDASNQNMPGYLDDCRVYNKVLSQPEIDQIFANTNPN